MTVGKGIMTHERRNHNRNTERRAAVEHTSDVTHTRYVNGVRVVDTIEVAAKDKFQNR